MYFHEIAQELKLHMDPAGRAGEFVDIDLLLGE